MCRCACLRRVNLPGDLFSALLLAWTHAHPHQPDLAVAKATATIQAVLRKTLEASGGRPEYIHRELRLIQSKVARRAHAITAQ